MSKDVDPMVPLMTGLLLGMVDKDGREHVKIAELTIEPPDSFLVHLASGMILRVKVSRVE